MRSPECTQFGVPVNLTANVSATLDARADLGLVLPTYTFATPVFGGQLSVGAIGIYGRVDTSLAGTVTGILATPLGTLPFSRLDSISDAVTSFGDVLPIATLHRGAALLFPISWPEPFGLVMIEAMACGTPIIAWPRGSVPEIVEDGITGFLVESEAEAVAAIERICDLDRRHIRERFDERFTARRMAEEYINSYRMLMFQSQMQMETRQIDRTETPRFTADSDKRLDAFSGK
jgi:hypothetical protein